MHSPLQLRLMPGPALAFVLLFLLGLLPASSAAPARAQSANPELDRQARDVGADLRCPVCENLSVADSPSPLAAQMRGIIRQKLNAGDSRQAIMQYFVDRYGQSILLNPPQQGFTMLVWLGAVLAVVGGAALLAVRLRRALSPSSPATFSAVVTHTPLALAARGGALAETRPQPATQPGQPGQPGADGVDYYEVVLDAELEEYKRGGRA